MRYCSALMFIVLAFQLHAFAGGDGSANDPYQVSTLAELQDVGSHLGSHFIQTADIDATDTANWNDGNGFVPIGSSTDPFTGSYDGQGHSITNLMVNRGPTGDIGLFGCSSGASICNLQLLNCDIDGNQRVGALVGQAIDSTVENCGSSGLLRASWAGGGLIGRANHSDISRCYSIVAVRSLSGGDYRGGLIGATQDTCSVKNCYARGSVDGNEETGGLVGRLSDTKVDRCYSAGPVSGITTGGLVGNATGSSSVSRSFWDTEASGQSTSALGEGKTTAEMKYFYMYDGTRWDFVGENRIGTNDIWDFDMSGVVNDGYPCMAWENDTTCLQPPAGSGTSADPYLVATLYDLWWISANSTKWNKSYLQTADIDATETAGWNNGAGFYPIGIDGFSGSFSGAYRGDGYTIDGLYSHQGQDNVGMFGYTYDADLYDIHLTNVDIVANHCGGALVGDLSDGNIRDCTSSGTVQSGTSAYSGYGYSGGLVGATLNILIERCSSSATVSGTSYAGGVVGYAAATWLLRCSATGDANSHHYSIENYAGGLVGCIEGVRLVDCYSTGNVSSDEYAGGLVAASEYESEIINCYSTGYVEEANHVGGLISSASDIIEITASFWNVETSGMSTSAGGTGLTTMQMLQPVTFINAGWDFPGETANGNANIWYQPAGDYPRLAHGQFAPTITAANDVPNDQGRQMLIEWSAASLDDVPFSTRYYSVWRLTENARAADSLAVVIESMNDFTPPDEDHTVLLHQRDSYWACLATIPAMMWDEYHYYASTLVDSSASLSPAQYQSTFRVYFHFESGFYRSNEATGYSVDNIPPYATRNVHAVVSAGSRNPSISLNWDEVTEGGLYGNSYPEQNGVWYRVYGGTTPDFPCNDTTLIATTQGTTLNVDITGQAKRFFKVIVSDQP